MKILHLNDHLSFSGGIETYLLGLIPRLEALGHAQTVAYAHGDDSLVENSRQVSLLSRGDRRARRAVFGQVTNLLDELQPDVVHVHNVYNTGALAACLGRVPTFLHGHDYRYLCPASSFFHRRTETVCDRTCGPACFAVTLGRRCMSLRPAYAWNYYRRVRFVAEQSRRFAGVVAPSGYVKRRYVAAGFRPDDVTVIPYFCPLEPPADSRLQPPRQMLLYVGRVSANKGYRYFVEALGKLPGNIAGTMVGNFDSQTAELVRRFAERCGCSSRLELRPWAARDEMRAIYESASLLVFPSIWPETLGIVGLEALAYGVPVVASDLGGVREWLLDGQTGRLVPPRDSTALASAIRSILESPDQGRSLGEQGRALVATKFSPERHIADLLACYNGHLGTGSPRAPSPQPLNSV